MEIRGAVRRPGVYRLPEGTRLALLLDRAGGLRSGFCSKPLKNYVLKDGHSFFIPFVPCISKGGLYGR